MSSDLPPLDAEHDLESLVRELNRAARERADTSNAANASEATQTNDGARESSNQNGPTSHASSTVSESKTISTDADSMALPTANTGIEIDLPAPAAGDYKQLAGWCLAARAKQATDLLLVPGYAPTLRVTGQLEAIEDRPLTPESVSAAASVLVPHSERKRAKSVRSMDFAVDLRGAGRMRVNLHLQRGHWALAIRLLPRKIPSLKALKIPESVGRLCELQHGLVLVTGPTGSGKSTTLASLLQGVIQQRRVHVITIEDPVEYEQHHPNSVVEHIQIGRDAVDFPSALKAALRQDPDVLLVGEMREPETISMAVTAAETGHLVFSTLHAGDTSQALTRIIDAYQGSQQASLQTQLGISLAAVLSQILIPHANGKDRMVATELMLATDAVRSIIRNGNLERLRTQLSLDRKQGSWTFEDSLVELTRSGDLSPLEARRRARVPTEFDRRLDGDAL